MEQEMMLMSPTRDVVRTAFSPRTRLRTCPLCGQKEYIPRKERYCRVCRNMTHKPTKQKYIQSFLEGLEVP